MLMLAGEAALADAEQALQESLQSEGGLAAAHGALIEALYRSDRLSGVAYAALMKRLGTLQPARPQAAQRPAENAAADDRTILRFQRPQPDISGDKTILRIQPTPAHVTTRNTTGATSWSHPSHWTPTDSGPLGPGSVVKDRFVLEEKIGQGGMGTVYKARDRRKEEAQDRNPYVALKVLNEDFKRHPRSLQALQREARKAQALQHPNIVTVYDFDRDGTNVYMVMELLEGEPLDRLIRRHKGVGLESPAGVADRASDLQGDGLRARAGHRACGLQAGQCVPAERWHGEDLRLRHRAGREAGDARRRRAHDVRSRHAGCADACVREPGSGVGAGSASGR